MEPPKWNVKALEYAWLHGAAHREKLEPLVFSALQLRASSFLQTIERVDLSARRWMRYTMKKQTNNTPARPEARRDEAAPGGLSTQGMQNRGRERSAAASRLGLGKCLRRTERRQLGGMQHSVESYLEDTDAFLVADAVPLQQCFRIRTANCNGEQHASLVALRPKLTNDRFGAGTLLLLLLRSPSSVLAGLQDSKCLGRVRQL